MISIKDFLIEALINTGLYEMADSRQEYYRTFKNLYGQILENVGCILYAAENRASEENISHWLTELSAHVYLLRKTKLKTSKRRVIYQALDTMNADDSGIIVSDLETKFRKENFDINDVSVKILTDIKKFLFVDLPEIVCAGSETSGETLGRDTYNRLADALNVHQYLN